MKICIGIASRGCDIYYELVSWLIHYAQVKDHEYEMVLTRSPYSAAEGQQKLFEMATNSDYLFVVDADVCPPIGCIEQMLKHNKDIVLAPMWNFDLSQQDIHLGVCDEPTLKKRVYKRGSGLSRIYGGCFGAMLVSKRVLDVFSKANESFVSHSPLLTPGEANNPSDNIFFSKCIKLGIEVWADWDIKSVTHYRYVALCDNTVNNLLNRSHGK